MKILIILITMALTTISCTKDWAPDTRPGTEEVSEEVKYKILNNNKHN